MNTTATTKLTIGSFVNWAEPKSNVKASDDYCTQCGKKMGKNGFYVHVSTSGTILPLDFDSENYAVSQGCWSVGSECAKAFDKNVLGKVGA